ncbi:MAG: ArgE/DapE family deacylase [Herpetosiphon sp.]
MHDHVELLKRLVAIDSVNPDLVPGGAGEAAIARFVAGWLEKEGLDVRIVEPVTGRPSVVAVARGSGGGRSLVLNAHLDTVGVAGMAQPHDPIVEGNRLYGRGAYDMKAGLAAIMLVAAEARKHPLKGDVIVTAVADEENASIGTNSVLNGLKADGVIVTEPTELRVCVAHKGFVWLEVTTIGRAAHGSRPDEGIDAVAKMGHVLVGVERLDRELRSHRGPGLLPNGSIHAALISGGQERSSYPERCVVAIERRTVAGETAAQVEGEMRGILDHLAEFDSQFRAEMRTTLVREPFTVADDTPLVALLRRHATMTLGAEPEIVGETYWMDAALFSAAGIPTVVFGPGGMGAHAVVEWSDLDQLAQCTRILLATAMDFCA